MGDTFDRVRYWVGMTARWIARLFGTLIVGYVVVDAIGGGLNPGEMTGVERAMAGCFFTACLGMVLLWRWEAIGGVVSLGGMIGFNTVEIVVSHRLPGALFQIFLLPGALAIVAACCLKIHEPNQEND